MCSRVPAFFSTALLVASLVSGGSGDALARSSARKAKAPAAAPAAADVAKPTMKSLRLAKADWQGEFNEDMQSWTFEKFSPEGDGTFATNRFYLEKMPGDAPAKADAYAERLQKDESFQDIGYVFVKITKKVATADGWLITGIQRDSADDEDKGTPAFAMYRAKLGLLCTGSEFQTETLRDEAATACASAVAE